MIEQLWGWQVNALKRANALRFSADAVNEAVGAISSVFGDAWLSEACKPDLSNPLPIARHPIGRYVTLPGDRQIVTLLELVEYLKFASNSPAFRVVVDGLKSQYGPTVLQLAFAYRFAHAGAANVVLEPPVSGGRRGDIGFQVSGASAVAECYMPHVKSPTVEIDWLRQQCIELRGNGQPAVVSIALKMKRTPTAVERKTIVRLVREMAGKIDKREGGAHFAETEAAFISVAERVSVGAGQSSVGRHHPSFPDMGNKEPRTFGRVGYGPAELKGPMTADAVGGYPTADHVAIWLSDADEEAHSLDREMDKPVREVLVKLERKLNQTKVDASTKRLLIVSTWMTGQFQRVSKETIAVSRDRLFKKHTGVAGLIFVMRGAPVTYPRRSYLIVPILPDDDASFTLFVAEVVRLEQKMAIPPLTGT